MISGTIYGVVLNDSSELDKLAGRFSEKPYVAPPQAAVVYVRPRQCAMRGQILAPGRQELKISATIALLFGRDAVNVTEEEALACVGAACLALDVSLPQADYYRPAIAQQAHDTFLPLGEFIAPAFPLRIETAIDGEIVHEWSLERLERPAPRLIADLSAFMTLRAGDLLLIGLPGDAPLARTGQAIEVRADGFPSLRTGIEDTRP